MKLRKCCLLESRRKCWWTYLILHYYFNLSKFIPFIIIILIYIIISHLHIIFWKKPSFCSFLVTIFQLNISSWDLMFFIQISMIMLPELHLHFSYLTKEVLNFIFILSVRFFIQNITTYHYWNYFEICLIEM